MGAALVAALALTMCAKKMLDCDESGVVGGQDRCRRRARRGDQNMTSFCCRWLGRASVGEGVGGDVVVICRASDMGWGTFDTWFDCKRGCLF